MYYIDGVTFLAWVIQFAGMEWYDVCRKFLIHGFKCRFWQQFWFELNCTNTICSDLKFNEFTVSLAG